ncbi:MAG: hypothetical protein E6J75_00260 [Deltaproteobacteria bacterium]|nr:MAG: hypothetical protein E6J75_00260 [Deltaproteobacteria bacterium]
MRASCGTIPVRDAPSGKASTRRRRRSRRRRATSLPITGSWRRAARWTALLWSQLREQIHEDGGHRGRNPVAHALVLADYLEILAFLRASNDDAPPWACKSVKSMADFLARLLHPDGELPLFHDAALGVSLPARELLATAAALFHEPSLASAGELPGVWPLLVLGDAGRRAHANLPRRREGAEPRALRRTGFYVLPGDTGDVMLLDGGTPPPGGDPNLFGYELSVGGMRIIVDAGVGGEEPGPWGDYFRSTRAHNTVAVDDVDDRRWPEVSDVRWIMRDGLLGTLLGDRGRAARGGRGRGGVVHPPAPRRAARSPVSGTSRLHGGSVAHGAGGDRARGHARGPGGARHRRRAPAGLVRGPSW